MLHVCYTDLKLNALGEKYMSIGIDKLTNGSMCILILSGGQGTRLGVNYPKGCYVLDGASVSLFGIHCANLKRACDLYKTKIMLILMVSRFTEKETISHFEENNFFGFDKSDVFFIKQGENECVDLYGNVLMASKTEKCKSPNGNGGVFEAFNDAKILCEIKNRRVELVNVVSVDNVLARCCDPVAIGCFYDNSYEILSKGVDRLPNENAGIFVDDHGLKVVEYSEIKDKNGQINDHDKTAIVGSEGKAVANICNHLFSVEFMEKMKDKRLSTHKAFKKIPCFVNGKQINPDSPNGYKAEFFIFDSFEFADRLGVIEVPRCLDFSPLKNSSEMKVDCPETCLRDLRRRNEIIKENLNNEHDKVFLNEEIK